MAALSLPQFLARAGGTRFEWGRWDCCLWLAEWLMACGYPDPAAHLRGRYATALGCARLLGRLGGVPGAVRSCVEPLGLAAASAPQAGDIGVVEAMTAKGPAPVGGLCTGPRWAVLGAGSLLVFPATPIAAWRV